MDCVTEFDFISLRFSNFFLFTSEFDLHIYYLDNFKLVAHWQQGGYQEKGTV